MAELENFRGYYRIKHFFRSVFGKIKGKKSWFWHFLTFKDEDSDDGWIGPTLSEAAPEKKIRKKVLPFENVYLENLPDCDTYERSFMHRDVVSWCLSSGPTCFVITGSVDGHVKVSFNYYMLG